MLNSDIYEDYGHTLLAMAAAREYSMFLDEKWNAL